MIKKGISIKLTAGAALLLQASSAMAFDWRQYEGVTLNAIFSTGPYLSGYIEPQLEEFEKETGIRVRIESLTDTQANQKQTIALSGKDPSIDVIAVQMDDRGGAYTVAGYLANLEPFLNDPKLTPPDYDYGDFAKGCLATTNVVTGAPLNNIVFSAQAQLLHIRTDLFREKGVKVPETLAELEDAARKLTLKDDNGNVEVYGFLSRGSGLQATASFATYLRNFGGSWFVQKDGAKRSGIAEPAAIDALEYYGRLIREYAPPSALANKHDANASLFAAGKVAILSELNYYTLNFSDPARSRVAGNADTILVPAGPAGSFPNIPTNSFAISEFSKNKEAAWLFITWITGKKQALFAQQNGIPHCRLSAWRDPGYKPPAPAWGKSSEIALEYGRALAKPPAIAINEVREAVGKVIDVAIRDGSRDAIEAEALKQAAIIDDLVARTEAETPFKGTDQLGAPSVPAELQHEQADLALTKP